eukprot:scaffold4124_cov252-Pinguiococcus_pyrenoidosus.AAC.3
MLQKCVTAGLRVMRLNFSHATFEEAELRMTNLRKAKGAHSRGLSLSRNLRAILLDTKGPEIRTGNMKGGEVELVAGQTVTLTIDESFRENGTSEKLYQTYEELPQSVDVGGTILLDDGLIQLTVLSKTAQDVVCKVENGGSLSDRRGVNLPGAQVKRSLGAWRLGRGSPSCV